MIFFGNLGSGGQINGQVVKTVEVKELLSSFVANLKVFDTSKSNLWMLIFEILRTRDNLHIVCLGRKGLFFYYFVSLLFLKFNINRIFIVVGGWLPEYLSSSHMRFLSKFFKSSSTYLVESSEMQSRLSALDYSSEILSNFRTGLMDGFYVSREYKVPIRLVFLSRLVPEKGVFDAIDLVHKLNSNGILAHLDIFGVGSKEEINALKRTIGESSYVNFCGSNSPDNSSKIISNYHFLVLPTRYSGECMPGVVVEAFATGTPVLSTKWRYMPEMVDHNATGALFDVHDFSNQAFMWLSKLKPEAYQLLQECSYSEYQSRFSSSSALAILRSHIVG